MKTTLFLGFGVLVGLWCCHMHTNIETSNTGFMIHIIIQMCTLHLAVILDIRLYRYLDIILLLLYYILCYVILYYIDRAPGVRKQQQSVLLHAAVHSDVTFTPRSLYIRPLTDLIDFAWGVLKMHCVSVVLSALLPTCLHQKVEKC